MTLNQDNWLRILWEAYWPLLTALLVAGISIWFLLRVLSYEILRRRALRLLAEARQARDAWQEKLDGQKKVDVAGEQAAGDAVESAQAAEAATAADEDLARARREGAIACSRALQALRYTSHHTFRDVGPILSAREAWSNADDPLDDKGDPELEDEPEWGYHMRRPGNLARMLLMDAILIGLYSLILRVYPDVGGVADVVLLSGLLAHWLIWALTPLDETAIVGRRLVRVGGLAAIVVLYAWTMQPFVPSGTIRFVHSHFGPEAALQGWEIQCGPRLQVVLPLVDRVYDYPIRWQRLEFSESGTLPPIRTETRNGHEVELDVAVIYRLFPKFDSREIERDEGEGRSRQDLCRDEVRAAYGGDERSPPERFGDTWQQRLIEPLVQRVVRDNVTRYYLNRVYSSDSRALIQGLMLAELVDGVSRRMNRRHSDTSTTPTTFERYIEMVPRAEELDAPALDRSGDTYPPPRAPLTNGERDQVPFLIDVERKKGEHRQDTRFAYTSDTTLDCLRRAKAGTKQTCPKGELGPGGKADGAGSGDKAAADGEASRHNPIAGGLFEFHELVVLDVRILDREFARRIRQKHLQEEAREELVIENRRLDQELANVRIRKEIELHKALIEADRVKVLAEAELQKTKLEAEGIEKRGVALANARKMLVNAHGPRDNAFTQIEVARHLAAGIERVIVTPQLEHMVPIIGDIGTVMEALTTGTQGVATANTMEEALKKTHEVLKAEARGEAAAEVEE